MTWDWYRLSHLTWQQSSQKCWNYSFKNIWLFLFFEVFLTPFGLWVLCWMVNDEMYWLSRCCWSCWRSGEHLSFCHWPAFTRFSRASLTNMTMWRCTYVRISTAPASCCSSPWVMTHATYPLLCIQRGGNFSLREANQTSDSDYRGSASPPIFLWDHQSCWWARSLSQSCKAFSEADGWFRALVWTKRWHHH